MNKSPIAFFAYNRPEHTLRSLESLSKNEGTEESELFVFCDGAKNQEHKKSVEEVRKIVRSKQWCAKVNIIERESNLGLANSIIKGVTDICNEFGSVIVVEDDLVLSPFFLDYMNTSLNLYKDTEQVMQIAGHTFPLDLKDYRYDAMFLPLPSCWGWGVWKRSWDLFDRSMTGYEQLKNDLSLRYKFNINDSYSYYKMLENRRNKKLDSWAIIWYLSMFIQKGLALFPSKSLVKNIGFDGSGTHGRNDQFVSDLLYTERITRYPVSCEIYLSGYLTLAEYFKTKI